MKPATLAKHALQSTALIQFFKNFIPTYV